MSAVTAVAARLEALTAVTNLVGARIYGGRLPHEPTLEAIRLTTIGTGFAQAMGGRAGVVVERVQVDCFGNTYAEAKALAAAVRGDGAPTSPTGLDRFRGSAGGVTVQDVWIENDLDIPEPEAVDGHRVFRVLQDYNVAWEG